MRKKSLFILPVFCLLTIVAFITTAAPGPTVTPLTSAAPGLSHSTLPGVKKNDRQYEKDWQYQFDKYVKIYSAVKEYYPGEYNKEKLFFSSIESFLRSLDPHSYFLDPLSVRAMNEDQQGNYYGIGTRISKYEDRLTVIAAIAGSPAERLGIMAGDVVVEINGQETGDMSLDEAMKQLRGAKNTTVQIKIKREGIDNLLAFAIPRAEIPLDSISYAVIHPLEPAICCIGIRTFGSTTAAELKQHLDEFSNSHDIQALVLDLRWNVGGSLFSAIDVSELFLEKGKTIVSIKGRELTRGFAAEKNGQYENLPLVVLINRVSASASEILAAALQDHERAPVIGTRSWGKGLVQTVYKLPMESCVALTSAKYYTPKNNCLQRDFSNVEDYFSVILSANYDHNDHIKGGVQPDIIVEDRSSSNMIAEFISKGVFFLFARHYIAACDKTGTGITGDFTVTPEVIGRFGSYLEEHHIDYKKERFKKDIEAISENIEREVMANKFSIPEGVKVFLKSDPVTSRAVAILKESSGRKF